MGPAGENVPEDQYVTQLGYVVVKMTDWHRVHFSFRTTVKADTAEMSMSVIHGRLPVKDVVPLVARGDRAGSADAVRYAQVGDLVKAGFSVVFDPTPTINDHVAVSIDGEVAAAFSQCFTEYRPECG